MNRKLMLLVLTLVCVMSVVSIASVSAQDESVRVKLVINGVLGDKSFFDSAQRGIDQIADDYDAEVNTVELGIDPQNWETGLDDAMATDDYDVLISGTFQMLDYMAARADKYPDKTFIFFDASMPYDDTTKCVDGCKNVYSITYKQNEGSFAAGVYAAAITTSGIDGTNADPIIGSIGGQDIPVINDFIVGYEQGACLVNPDSQVLVQYAGNWNDPAKGKEIALAMYDQKADIVFQVAGGTGVGVFEAAQEQSHFAIGVDSDQASIVMETDPDQAARILTSMQKNVDNSLVRAFEMYQDGTLPVGTAEALGLKEGGVSLSVNDIYTENTPQNIQDLVAAVTEAVSNGDISVNTVFGDADKVATVGQGCDKMPETTFDASEYLKAS